MFNMRIAITGLMLFALTAPYSFAQKVSLPQEVKGAVGAFIQIPAETSDPYVSWLSLDIGLNMFPVSLLKDTKTAVVTSTTPGRYRVAAVTAKGDKPSEFAYTLVIVGNPTPVPPIPPGPDPPVPPIPPSPVPIPLEGFRVLIVYDPATLTPAQEGIVYGKECRDYMQAKSVVGADMKTKDFWIIQAGSDTTAAPKWIGDVIQRHPGQRTFMCVSNGKVGYDGVIPMDSATALSIMKGIGGP